MRLIDADELRDFWLENGENEYIYDTNAVLDSIDEASTIDPKDLQPHGHWIEHPTGGLVCSHCDRYKPDEWRSMCCPNCRASMQEEPKK